MITTIRLFFGYFLTAPWFKAATA
ncbi:MAG: hypothetical protein H6R21_1200, partial [Proteobacteria bacterium]|nr:hypothetical protein [Pseudomonadota bacterium]